VQAAVALLHPLVKSQTELSQLQQDTVIAAVRQLAPRMAAASIAA